MCGIGFWIEWFGAGKAQWRRVSDGAPDPGGAEHRAPSGAFQSVPAALFRRGPDFCSQPPDAAWSEAATSAELGIGDEALRLRLCGAVLHLRGLDGVLVAQPVRTSVGELLFNGEIFGVDGLEASADILGRGVSDTEWLAAHLETQLHAASGAADSSAVFAERFRDAVEPLQGPYAIIYWAATERVIVCARDPLGRRSLLYAIDEDGGFCVASVPPTDKVGAADGWRELPCGVVCISLSDPLKPSIDHFTWKVPRPPFVSHTWWPGDAPAAKGDLIRLFRASLSAAVARRVLSIPEPPPPHDRGKVGVLFSGGLDSAVLAALTAEALGLGCKAGNQASTQPIELINIAFEATAPDRVTALLSYEDLVAAYGPQTFKLLCIDVASEEVVAAEEELLALLGTADHRSHLDFNIACALYFAARGKSCRRCCNDYFQQPWWQALAASAEATAALSEQARVTEREAAVLNAEAAEASGGPCALCSSASKPRCVHGACKLCCKKLRESVLDSLSTDRASDRPMSNRAAAVAAKLERVALEARHRVCPVHREKGGGNTIPEPKDMDDENEMLTGPGFLELASRHYLASAEPPVDASCRVLLLGSGADELLGGYARHVTALRKRGIAAMREEMLMDLNRLWTRNLGRDDRVISAFGREPRHPFLDEEFLRFVGALPLPSLLCPAAGEPVSKWLLRQVAVDLGLHRAANFKKRAIQFGSRVAKNSNLRHFGGNRKAKGDAQYVRAASSE